MKRLLNRVRLAAHWRCAEPVIVLESDDWGLERRSCAALLSRYGQPGAWAEEMSETADDLSRLYAALESYRDPSGRPACFVANFVTGRADDARIAGAGFAAYYDLPLAQAAPGDVIAAWRAGMARRVFYPQYHGRAHFWPGGWLADLRADTPGARRLFEAGCAGGLSLLQNDGWRYHSEYLDWQTGQQPDLAEWLRGGLDYFRELFGFAPCSTIAPHYLFTARSAAAWARAGLRYVQGANYRILRRANGAQKVISHALGERGPGRAGSFYLARNVKFEPRPQRPEQGVAAALCQIEAAFRWKIPAVVDTHRINYTAVYRDGALAALYDLLNGLRDYRPYVLTSAELGEAIAHNGAFRDVWTGEMRRLTPLDPPGRRALRLMFGALHRRIERAA